ncbi:uncharacterized protein G2W53_035142 [Senna tora]|uniref:Uncharacterized protein n=1 Tax=Senna tora TaxID=362788 RepID=A0A834W8Y7_9FABA|nr:uncharacterized protein G2W53_035142 [Senna tora]
MFGVLAAIKWNGNGEENIPITGIGDEDGKEVGVADRVPSLSPNEGWK